MSTDGNEFRKVQWDGDEPLQSDDDGPDGMPLRPHGPGLSAEDLELLTLAARAIGAVRIEEVEGEAWLNLHFADGSTAWNWNPLLHGDDAFNLAVDLGLQVFPAARTLSGEACAAVAGPAGMRLAEERSVPDAHAATRRAATRAAAEIGKARPQGSAVRSPAART